MKRPRTILIDQRGQMYTSEIWHVKQGHYSKVERVISISLPLTTSLYKCKCNKNNEDCVFSFICTTLLILLPPNLTQRDIQRVGEEEKGKVLLLCSMIQVRAVLPICLFSLAQYQKTKINKRPPLAQLAERSDRIAQKEKQPGICNPSKVGACLPEDSALHSS